MTDISDRLFISTIADDCDELAARYGVGLEICEFCTATNMDPPHFAKWDAVVRDRIRQTKSLIFHSPSSEIYPSAIDPKIAEVTFERLTQAADIAMGYGIHRMVVHGGYLPNVYFPEWFHERSILFWKRFLKQIPDDFQILLENVVDDRPERLLSVVLEVNDPRMGLCFDVGHVSASTNVSVEDWLCHIEEHISHVHIHNNFGGRDLHLPLGEGSIDMDFVLREILEHSSKASFTIENIHATPSIEWLVEHGYIGGK